MSLIKNKLINSKHQIIYGKYKKLKKQLIVINAKNAQTHYAEIIKRIKQSKKTKINFAAYVMYASSYGMDSAFIMMMDNCEEWNPKIVIIPDVYRGIEHAKDTYEKTKEFFIEKYGFEYVIDGWNPNTNEFYNPINQFDVVYYANPYDVMAHEYHSIHYASKQNVLPIHVSYGYDISMNYMLERLTTKELNLVWRCYTDTTYSLEEYKKNQIIKAKNVKLIGYSKMDKFADYDNKKYDNKKTTILITPHHTIESNELPLSNFLRFSDLILQLPDLYPEIQFIFRPHPLLFTNLINFNKWTKVEINEYLKQLQSKGVVYSFEGDYLEIFSKSDAIINDCGSFSIEWLLTGKPGCFVKNPDLKEEHLTPLMRKAISEYSIANSKEDIINFINQINKETHDKNYEMKQWVRENVAVNYPNVSKKILEDIKQEIL